MLLSALPMEIMANIALDLTSNEKANLIRVSRQVRRLTESTLYEKISFKRASASEPPYHLLLRTALRQPRLMNLVKCLQIAQPSSDKLWSSKEPPKLDEATMESIVDFVRSSKLARSNKQITGRTRSSNIRDNEPWLQDLLNGDKCLYQALLVSLLPNLRILRIGLDHSRANFDYLGTSLFYALSSAVTNSALPGYRQLQKLTYSSGCLRDLSGFDGFCHSATAIVPFFYLPRVEEIRAVFPPMGVPFAWPGVPPCARTLRVLRLQRSYVDLEGLAKILASSPNLAVLEYDLACDVGYGCDDSLHVFSCQALDHALVHVRKTLEELRIALHFYPWGNTAYERRPLYAIEGVLHSLSSFERLFELEVPFPLLLRSQDNCVHPPYGSLPQSIQRVVLRDDLGIYEVYSWRSGWVMKCFLDCVHLWSCRSPSLRVIGLNIEESNDDFNDDWHEETIQEFRRLCQARSIMPLIHQKRWKRLLSDPIPQTPIFGSREFT